MKKIFLASILVIFTISCSNEYKAKKTIERYLSERLHDWDSYESVSFSDIDSLFQEVPDNPYYKLSIYKQREYVDLVNDALEEYDYYDGSYSEYSFNKKGDILEKAKVYADSARKYTSIVDSFMVDFKPYFIGWKVGHSYRANNAGGNKIISYYQFHLEKDCDRIIEVIDLND